MADNINIGQMYHKIRIMTTSDKSLNDLGEPEFKYTGQGYFYAHVENAGGSETEKNDVKVFSEKKKFTIRYENESAIDANAIIIHNSKVYDVERVYPIGRNNYVVIEAVTRHPLDFALQYLLEPEPEPEV